MVLTIDKRYLKIPASYKGKNKKLLFYEKGLPLYELDIKPDFEKPDTFFYVDVSRFFGKELTLELEFGDGEAFELTDTYDDAEIYSQPLRPAAHFTAKRGWLNDPNGLCFYEGKYHLFFQHNPVGVNWGNMHWGHAASRDLLRWREEDVALYPDELGMMYSGSAFIDSANASGLGKDAILLYYTAAGGMTRLSKGGRYTQCLAFSTDGAGTFRKYDGNPLINQVTDGNRDPKVVLDPVSGKYYMALYLEDDMFALFTSSDLLHWDKIQKIKLPKDRECPDFYPLSFGGETFWIFSGASDRYLAGKVGEGGRFKPIEKVKRLHYGTNSYAAQTFHGVKDGRTLRMAWNTSNIPSSPFNCAMCTPCEMSLETVGGEIRLCINPISEIKTLYGEQQTLRDTTVKAKKPLTLPLKAKAHDITLSVPAGSASFRLSLRGIEMKIDTNKKLLRCRGCIMPLGGGEETRLRMITDTNAVEIYADKGGAFAVIDRSAAGGENELKIFAGRADLNIKELFLAELKNIWGA